MTHVIAEIIHDETYRYDPLGKHVVRAVDICGGRPTFTYTRMEMAAGYRGRVSREAILEAIQIVTASFLKTLPALEPA